MNSKDALDHVCDICDHDCCPYIHYDKSRCVFYGVIRKDLEVLKMLKNYIDFYTYHDTDSDSCINIVITESVKNYTIIKEWLKNERKEFKN